MNLVTLFNQILTSIILLVWSAISTLLPPPVPKRPTPSARKVVPTSALIAPVTPQKYIVTQTPVPWGTTEKIGEHEYRTYVANDPVMGTPTEILAALNSYRKIHGRGEVKSDDNLCKLATWRAQTQDKAGTLDGHKGLEEYMKDPKHWEELNVSAIGENASYGYVLSGTHLIEWVFDSDVEHRDNQLNPNWNLGCAGISGVTVDIIFGHR